ncbi:MAG: DNA-binding response regulator [Candidatus Puniceispirillales bacterium]
MKVILTYGNIFSRDLIIEHIENIEQAGHLSPNITIIPSNRVLETIDIIHRGEVVDLIILDTGLPDMKGLTGLSRVIDATQGKRPVAVMGVPTSQSEMRMVLDAGARGYIPKNLGIKAFFSAMMLMANGEIYLPADGIHHQSENSFIPNDWLTGREQDMLAGLLAGKSNKEIARIHGLSEVTVKHHLKSLRGKLGARNRTHAVCRAIELGIVPDQP